MVAAANNTFSGLYNSVSGAPTTAANPFNFGANDQYQFAQQPGGYQDPSYQFRVDEGMRNLLANKAAFGGLGSGNTLRDVINYGQNAASQEYGAAYNRFNQDRSFNEGVNERDRAFAAQQAAADLAQQDWEKQFGYNAAVNDQNTNWAHQMALANLGLAGAGGEAGANSTLAQILANLTTASGQAGATGTIGQGNAITGGIGQLIQQWLAQQQLGQQNDRTAQINRYLYGG